jgi:hypothetical protein
MKTKTLKEKVRYAQVRLESGRKIVLERSVRSLWTGFRCVQVRFDTKLMKNLVFHYKRSLLMKFPLCTESVVDWFYCILFFKIY